MCLADLLRLLISRPLHSFPLVLPPPDLYRIDSSTGYWSTKLHLIIRKRSRRSVTHWFSFFTFHFSFCCLKWFEIFSFAIPSAALNDTHCLRSFYTGTIKSPFISCRVQISSVCLTFFHCRLMLLLKSRQYDCIIRFQRYYCFTFDIHNLHSGYIVSHCANLHSSYLRYRGFH